MVSELFFLFFWIINGNINFDRNKYEDLFYFIGYLLLGVYYLLLFIF